jgi:ligand-binding SRPBCC domain-containing protein
MPHSVEFEQWVPFPIEPVFRFFANPENLPRIMPRQTQTRIDELHLVPPLGLDERTNVNRLAGRGTEIVTSFRILPLLPLRAQWIARITEFEWNHYFADIQVKGPFQTWHHRHELATEVRDGIHGTVVRDRIEYAVGPGILGEVAARLFVARQLRRTFLSRQKTLPTLLAGAPSS